MYFGDIGDEWKHLAFTQVVATEQPRHVWESHAGSALYSLSHSSERDFGVYYFREHASTSTSLGDSMYAQILRELATAGPLRVYPGSPFLAMRILMRGPADFVFCDTDEESLADIQDAASRLSIDAARLRLIHGDGVSTVAHLGAALPAAETASTLVHIDPYYPLQESSPGLNAIDLLCQLSARGIRYLLWFGYRNLSMREGLFQALHHSSTQAGSSAERLALWCGDIRLAGTMSAGREIHTGPISCLVLGSHLGEHSRTASDELGYELARIYAAARLADGSDPAMEYTSFLVTNDA
jgi:23S rRNA A2030 N6-methylase RlmJ